MKPLRLLLFFLGQVPIQIALAYWIFGELLGPAYPGDSLIRLAIGVGLSEALIVGLVLTIASEHPFMRPWAWFVEGSLLSSGSITLLIGGSLNGEKVPDKPMILAIGAALMFASVALPFMTWYIRKAHKATLLFQAALGLLVVDGFCLMCWAAKDNPLAGLLGCVAFVGALRCLKLSEQDVAPSSDPMIGYHSIMGNRRAFWLIAALVGALAWVARAGYFH